MPATLAVSQVSERQLVMRYAWEQFLDCLASREHERADGHYGFYRRLKDMSDEEYIAVTVCDQPSCYCHM